MRIAGKTNPERVLRQIGKTIGQGVDSPAVFIPTTAALTGGASLAVNAMNAGSDPKPTERVIAEAALTGLAGAAGAYGAGRLGNMYRNGLTDFVKNQKSGIGLEKARYSAELNPTQNLTDKVNARINARKQLIAESLDYMPFVQNATAVGVPLAGMASAGIGGLVAGGTMNVIGVPQRQEAQASQNVQEYLAGLQMENATMQSGGTMPMYS
jgi:hypothetical protein